MKTKKSDLVGFTQDQLTRKQNSKIIGGSGETGGVPLTPNFPSGNGSGPVEPIEYCGYNHLRQYACFSSLAELQAFRA